MVVVSGIIAKRQSKYSTAKNSRPCNCRDSTKRRYRTLDVTGVANKNETAETKELKEARLQKRKYFEIQNLTTQLRTDGGTMALHRRSLGPTWP